jgi:hypothetical protein
MYIPTSTHVPQPSAQAQDLGQRIATTVRTYLAENPGVGSTDVAQAFMVAREQLRAEAGGVSRQAMILVVAALLGVLALGVLFALNVPGGLNPRIPTIVVGLVVVAIAVLVFAVANKGA